MYYFDNFDNKFLYKYEKNLKSKRFIWYVLVFIDWQCFKFNAILLSFDNPLKIIKILFNLKRLEFNDVC
jgi:hypothetical protein